MFRFGSRTRETLPAKAECAPTGPDDAALVAAARADPRAFAALYDRYVGPVYGYGYTRLGQRETAEDATSEVFVKALAALGGYRDGAFAAWLFRIARNVVIDARRRRRPTEPLAAAAEAPDPGRTPEEIAVGRSEREALRAALARLPDDQRAAVELGLAGWTGEQAAAALGRSADAVKMLRFRAHARLRQLLQPTNAPPPGRQGHYQEKPDERA